MTSKLKCPFCGKDLMPTTMIDDGDCTLYSSVWHPIKDCVCNTHASKKIWQTLIQAKQDLKNARKALEELIAYYDHYNSFDGEISWDGVALIMRNDAHEALKQIEHKDKNNG